MGSNFELNSGTRALGVLLIAASAVFLIAALPFPPGGALATAQAKKSPDRIGKKLRIRPPVFKVVSSNRQIVRSGWIKVAVRGRAKARRGKFLGRMKVTFRGSRGKRASRAFAAPLKLRIVAGKRVVGRSRLNTLGKRLFSRCDMERGAVAIGRYKQRGDRRTRTRRKVLLTGCGGPPPPPARRPETASCDPIDPAHCLLPWPSDHFAKDDASSPTGQRLNLADDQMPADKDRAPIRASDYNESDGFSPGQPILTYVPGLDTPAALAQTDAAPVNSIGRYSEPDAPVVVIDAETKERVPIWVELDSQAGAPSRTLLQIHPAVPLDYGRRYLVALRHLKRADGSTIEPQSAFRKLRDTLPADWPTVPSWKQVHTEQVFSEIGAAGIARQNLYLAWDFTVASETSITGRMLSIRDRAFAELGDHDLADRLVGGAAPGFTVDSVDHFTPAADPRIARVVRGRVTVPCFMAPDCDLGGRFELDSSGLPQRNGNWQASFVCIVPRSSESSPARASVYGHGLFHVKEEVEGINHRRLSNDHNVVQCATAQIGMSSDDAVNTLTTIIPKLSRFPQLADRLQQGMLNELFLGRLMIHPQGLISHPAFRVDEDPDGLPVIATGATARLGYSGYSLGGILGGLFTAVSPDSDRSVLGVPGMRFSMLLPRSTQYDPFGAILAANYTDPLERSLILSVLQLLWDRGEPNGYAKRITTPLAGTPPHEVLILVAFGDHQVSNFGSDLLARATGASVRQPLLDPGRWPGMDPVWGISPIGSYPHAGSGMVYADTGPTRPGPAGTDPPPLVNQPNRTGVDPHGAPWGVAALRQSVSDFLQPDGKMTNPCGLSPCYAGGWSGP